MDARPRRAKESLAKRYTPASIPSPAMGPQHPGRLLSLDGPFLFSSVVLEMLLCPQMPMSRLPAAGAWVKSSRSRRR
jgi:hypothetical protein